LTGCTVLCNEGWHLATGIDFTAMKNSPKKITLFVQCLVDGLYPEVGEAMLKIFKKLDLTVECPADQTCCGQPAFNTGYRREARIAAKRFIRIFEKAAVLTSSHPQSTRRRNRWEGFLPKSAASPIPTIRQP